MNESINLLPQKEVKQSGCSFWSQRMMCLTTFYSFLLVTNILSLTYIVMISNKVEDLISGTNTSEFRDYAQKIEHIVNFICSEQDIC